MKKYFLILISFILVMSVFLNACGNMPLAQSTYKNKKNFEHFFKDQSGCAIFYDEETDSYKIHNENMLDVRMCPCCTFNIIIVLAGLKYKVLEDSNTLIKWDGVKRDYDFWNKDLTLKEAFDVSAVWYFKEVANRLGVEKISKIVEETNYGNCNIGDDQCFWIDSSLEISTREQVEFLRRLFNYKFDFDKRDIEILKEVMYRGDLKDGSLYGKTGTSIVNKTGWFVGIYTKDENTLYFAVRIYGDEEATGPNAKKISESIINTEF